MTIRPLLLAFATAFAATPAIGPAAMAQTNTVDDEIIVQGTKRGGDPAMDAFFAGDFETAEIEFEKNFRIIKRERSDIERASEFADTREVADLGATNVTAGGRDGGAGVTAGTDLSGVVPNSIAGSRPRDGDPNVVYSGRDLGFQKYMAGLSELQQGKVVEAEKSFESAVALNKTLYDGRMRLGLIRLGMGDRKGAKKQLGILNGQANKCGDDCERRDELMESRALLEQLLEANSG